MRGEETTARPAASSRVVHVTQGPLSRWTASWRLGGQRLEHGFTLIELFIVVIILGILAAVVIFGVSTFRKGAVT